MDEDKQSYDLFHGIFIGINVGLLAAGLLYIYLPDTDHKKYQTVMKQCQERINVECAVIAIPKSR